MTRGSERNSARYFRTERGEGSAGVPRFTSMTPTRGREPWTKSGVPRRVILGNRGTGRAANDITATDCDRAEAMAFRHQGPFR